MAAPQPPRPTTGAAGKASGDWTGEVTDRIVSTIDTVRDKTTVPITTAARALVYGVVAGVAGLVGGLVLLILVFRLLYTYVGYLPWVSSRDGRSVWLVDVTLGILVSATGLLLMRKGRKAPEPET